MPLAAQAPLEIPPQTIRLRGGESQDLYLNLGADNRSDVNLEARLSRIGRWPKRLHLGIVRNATQDLVTETVLQYIPGGRVLWLEAAADRCAPAGAYRAVIEISALEPNRAAFGKASIPLNVEIAESWACKSGRAVGFLLTLPMGLCFLFVLNSYTNSTHFSLDRLVSRLQPSGWDGERAPFVIKGSEVQVKQRIARSLNPVERARFWCSANPFRLLRPGRVYEEALEIIPNDRVERLQVRLVSAEDARYCWEKRLSGRRGRLFAIAERGGRLLLLAILNKEGELAGLKPREFSGETTIPAKLQLFRAQKGADGWWPGWTIKGARVAVNSVPEPRR